MRVGLSVSIVGHLAILGFGFIAFPDARPFVAQEIEALPVDLVPISEETDLLAGDKKAETLAEKPQPKPQAQAETPSPEQAEKPAEKPVEAARAPMPPPPPPPELEVEPEPEPEPEQEMAALPEPPEPPPPEEAAEPLPEAEPEAAPPKPVESRVPKARPKPPKPVAQPKPAPQEQDRLRELAEQQPEQEFDVTDISALLNKTEAQGGGDPAPSPEPQTLGSAEGKADAAMTQSELAALQARLYNCWNPPVGVRGAVELIVTVRISLLPDGSLAGQPQLQGVASISNPMAQQAVEAAIRAVIACSPFPPDILRPEKYAIWNQIDFTFDPRQMLGG